MGAGLYHYTFESSAYCKERVDQARYWKYFLKRMKREHAIIEVREGVIWKTHHMNYTLTTASFISILKS